MASATPRDLKGWIEHLEAEQLQMSALEGDPMLSETKRVHQVLRTNSEFLDLFCWMPPDHQKGESRAGQLPIEITYNEVLWERLLILWSDEELWRAVRVSQDSPDSGTESLIEWCRNKYHLVLPFAPSVWLEMVRHPPARGNLFQLMVISAWQFFWVRSLDPEKDLEPKWRRALTQEKLGKLLEPYLQNPGYDWRNYLRRQLAREDYPPEVLKRIQYSLNQLVEDLAYIIHTPTNPTLAVPHGLLTGFGV